MGREQLIGSTLCAKILPSLNNYRIYDKVNLFLKGDKNNLSSNNLQLKELDTDYLTKYMRFHTNTKNNSGYNFVFGGWVNGFLCLSA